MAGRSRLFLAAMAIAMAAAGASAAAAEMAPPAGASCWYLALGDSLSQGYQPLPGGHGAGVETDAGYPNVLEAALDRSGAPPSGARRRPTALVKLGCPGETTSTMVAGGICHYQDAPSQLAAASAFLRAHGGRVELVTIDIGINDVVPCEGGLPSAAATACLSAGLAALSRNLPAILGTVQRLAGRAVLIGLDYYDPYAVDVYHGAKGAELAAWAGQVTTRLNALLACVYARFGIPVADVAGAFSRGDPVMLCRLTWMCSGQPVGPNLHADAAGYRLMAGAVEAASRLFGPRAPAAQVGR